MSNAAVLRRANVVARARNALAQFASAAGAAHDGILPAAVLGLEGPVEPIARALVPGYLARQPAYGRDNVRRYHWSLGFHAEVGHPSYAAVAGGRTWWRPKEREWLHKRPGEYARRITLPVTLATQLEMWSRAAESDDPDLRLAARQILEDTQPVADADIARWIAASDPWADTFALWVLTAYPHAHARLRDLVFALAVRYAQIATRHGIVPGDRYPFFGQPLVSATAHLAMSLWRLGIYPTRQPHLIRFVANEQRVDGGWADPEQPSDVLTTLVCAELLASVDPTFEPALTASFFEQRQEHGGWWRALDPEVPWLTASIADWIERAALPFVDRFAWPDLPVWSRDRTTGLPTMAVFDELSVALAGIEGLSEQHLEVAFIDLAGFGKFNVKYGQDAGDAALAAYAAALFRIPRTLTIRQGGDELLVLGTPTAQGQLEPALTAFMSDWGAEAEAVGVPKGSVVPRIVLAKGRASDLRELRGRLGLGIGDLKAVFPEVEAPGVMRWLA